ncbi:MAG: DNA primase [Planctomycetota bacterium]
MARISDAQKDAIRQRADIIAVIGERVSLTQKGRDYWGCCPFHDEKTASFKVNPQKQGWYCFGACKKGGDVFTFVQEMEKVSFPEAMRLVARRVGVEIEEETPEERARSQRKAEILDVLNRTVDFYAKQLATGKSESAEQARAFLQRRGVTQESIAAFRLGVAPVGNLLARQASKVRGMLPLLKEVGLVRMDGRDFFSNRVMFPIADESGRCVGFGGRRLNEEDQPKFINSREVAGVFEKKRLLYGLDRARETRPGPKQLVVVEGYLDVVIAHQAGCTNVVAALGVGFTSEHSLLAKRFAADKRVILLFDGDAAGRAANQRVLEGLLDTDLDVRIASLPDGSDPDDLILREGKDGFDRLLQDGSRDLFQSLVDVAMKKSDRVTPAVVAECARLLGKFKDDIRHQLSLRHVADRLGFPEDLLRKEALKSREQDRNNVRPARDAAQTALRDEHVVENTHPQVREILGPHACAGEPVEVSLLEALLAGQPLQPEHGVTIDDFTPGPLREIASVILGGDPHVLDKLQGHASALGVATRLLARVDEHKDKNWQAEIQGGARALVARRNRARAERLVQEIEQANKRGDFDLVGRLLAEKTRLAREAR